MEPIEIVCGIDANYAPHLAVMLTSLVSCNPGQRFRVHVLHDGIDETLRARVEKCFSNVQIEWKAVGNQQVLGFEGFLHLSRAAYLRLAMLEALDTTIKRVLYLDVDLVINGDISPLWNMELGDKVCAAVIDPGVQPEEFAARYSLPPSKGYFNSGVMLLDIERLRERGLMKKAIELIANPSVKFEFADQDALNVVFWNQWLPVGLQWNFQRKFMYKDFSDWKRATPMSHEPVIIHFTEEYKPWRKTEWHPYAWLYLKSLLHTPFKGEVMRAGKISIVDCCKWWLRYVLKRKSVYTA